MIRRRRIALVAAVPGLILLLGAGDVPLSGGLWEIRNTPGVATLDGRELNELPIEPIETQKICISPAEAADPVRFFARDMDEGCTIKSASAAGGKVKIVGTCPNQIEGPDGSFELTGGHSAEAYEIDFATTAFGDNGRMTFSGKLNGRRVGDCPAE
ncbi:MAG TPA: DUF3617 family protein [Allosphingosinicella sp.]|nr:DUF3617 family protein [Allosphingosinicella sp.]